MHLKKKFLTANHVPYMTKSLREAIIRRAELESKYIKNRTIENKPKYKTQKNIKPNKPKYKTQKNYCKRLSKNERKTFYLN